MRGADDELAGERAHDRGEDGCQYEARDERVQEGLRHEEGDGLGVGEVAAFLLDVGDADETGEHGAGERDDLPGDADPAGAGRFLRLAQGHEAHDRVRLAEVAQTPVESRQHADDGHGRESGAAEDVEVVGSQLGDERDRFTPAADGDNRGDGQDDQRDDHHEPLHHIRQRCSEESAEQCVPERDDGDEDHPHQVVAVERAFEEDAARDHAGSDVEREEDEDDDA